jgi:hypothetical protein
MNRLKRRSVASSFTSLLLTFVVFSAFGKAKDAQQPIKLQVVLQSGVAEFSVAGQSYKIREGESAGAWTFMGLVRSRFDKKIRYAVLEDFTRQKGHILLVDSAGIQIDLPKSLEPTVAEPSTLYRGHTLQEVMNSDHDLLGEEILSKSGDPQYDEVAACLRPIAKMRTYTFVGTHESIDKLGFQYGGRTPSFDAAPYDPLISRVREAGKVWDGLIGGWLPVVRFVYPEDESHWTEMIAFAPLHQDNGNDRIQPVWYRVARIDAGHLKWARYFSSYHPFPPREHCGAAPFYEDLVAMREGWERALAPGMKVDIPDQRLADMARHSLVRDMITRVGDYPKYGVFDKNYGGSEHDGFPDTFNADTTAMTEWGLFGLARAYIANYLGKFVGDDGSILYRGPETGQYGRMLTVIAAYANYSGDGELLLKYRRRIDGVTNLLLSMRAKALKLPSSDPAYGMIVGWSEADSCLDPDPPRYMQPYFSNSTEAARGFGDLGKVWERIGTTTKNQELEAWGRRLVSESQALEKDIQTAIGRSLLEVQGSACLPAIAGVKEPFDVALTHDPLDPQYRSYRAYMEMLFSGDLTREQVETIVNYRAAHQDTILGIPTAYGYATHELNGFISYGHGYGLIQNDLVRKYLLLLYSIMAHQYTRGTWTAPETRNIDPDHFAAPYCTPAEMVVPMMTRWMLVFEDPKTDTLWLAKGTPRSWLEDGKSFSASNAPTKWGKVEFSVASHLNKGVVTATIQFSPSAGPLTKLRLRAPEGNKISSVMLNGKAWSQYDASEETITLPSHMSNKVSLTVSYQ